MDDETKNRLAALEQKIDAIYVSVEKTRKYFQITLWVTIIFFALPLVALFFVIPMVLSSLTVGLSGIEGL